MSTDFGTLQYWGALNKSSTSREQTRGLIHIMNELSAEEMVTLRGGAKQKAAFTTALGGLSENTQLIGSVGNDSIVLANAGNLALAIGNVDVNLSYPS